MTAGHVSSDDAPINQSIAMSENLTDLLDKVFSALNGAPFATAQNVLLSHLQRIISDESDRDPEKQKQLIKDAADSLKYRVDRVEAMGVAHDHRSMMTPPGNS